MRCEAILRIFLFKASCPKYQEKLDLFHISY